MYLTWGRIGISGYHFFSLHTGKCLKPPQDSAPFELLYGWPVQGPLDLLKQKWEKEVTTDGEKSQGVVQFVLQMRERLEQYREEAKLNLLEAQKRPKLWYDQQARKREFTPGQKVLLLLPSSTSNYWLSSRDLLKSIGGFLSPGW